MEHPRDEHVHDTDGCGDNSLQLRLRGNNVGPEQPRLPLGPPPIRVHASQPLPVVSGLNAVGNESNNNESNSNHNVSSSSLAFTGGMNNQVLLRQQAPSYAPPPAPYPIPSVDARINRRSPFARDNINISLRGYAAPLNNHNIGGDREAIPNYEHESLDGADTFPEEHNDDEMMHCGLSSWSEVDSAGGGIPPSARSLHSAALLNGVVYIFGGYDGAQRVNSFHAYSFTEKRWSPVLPSASSQPPPSPRDRHVSVAYGNSLYIHGGFDGSSRDDGFFGFDLSTMEWRQIVATYGRPPSARHSHAAVVHDHSMYVFGGYDGAYKSDLHEFDFTASRWNAVPAAGRRPRARYRGTCVVYRNFMILNGGHDGSRHLSDTFLFDFITKTWSSVIAEGPPPIPRDSHVSVVHGNSMYVFGGSSGSAMNDLHELQFVSNDDSSTVARWRPVITSRADQPRHRFCHVAVVHNDSMFCFGGYDGSERINSFIKFDFAVHDLSVDIPPTTIISDFRAMVNNETFSDITFIVEGRSVYAHKLMLMRCSYFEALFLGQMREANMDTVRIEQVRFDIFLLVLEYLYTDQLLIGFSNAMELFEAADLFCIYRLKAMCEKRMVEQITVDNAATIFHAADIHSATALRQKTKSYILSHFSEVSKSRSFEEMGRSNIELVFELLKGR